MKSAKAILSAGLCVLLLSGCASAPAAQQTAVSSAAPPAAPSAVSAAASSQPAASSEQASPQASSLPPVSSAPVGPQEGQEIGLSGQNNNFQLAGLEFLNAGTGWVIQNRFNDTGAAQSQLLRTQDGGASWNPVGDDSRVLDAVQFASASEGWALEEEPAYQILHTADGGASWETQGEIHGVNPSAPTLYFQDSKNGYALAGDFLMKTANGGKTWADVNFGQTFEPIRMFFLNAADGWVAGLDAKQQTLSLLYTSDGGKSWSTQFQKKSDAGEINCLGIDFLNSKEGWFLTSDIVSWNGGLYHTTDGGAHWAQAGTVASLRPTPDGICFVDSQTGWIPLDVGAGPVSGGLSVTHDGGRSFRVLGETDSPDTQKVISAKQVLFLSGKHGWAIGSEPGVEDYLLETQDGGENWAQVYPKPEPTVDLSFVNGQTGFGLGEPSDQNALLETQDGGESWREVHSFAGSYRMGKISFVSPVLGWVFGTPVGAETPAPEAVLETQDGGKTWSKVGEFPADYSYSNYFRFFNDKDGVAVRENNGCTIYRTSDGGKTWNAFSAKDPGTGTDLFYFLSPTLGWRLAAVYGSNAEARLYRATPDGRNFETAYSAIPHADVYGFVFRNQKEGVMLALPDSASGPKGKLELLTTQDGGQTWKTSLLPAGSSNSVSMAWGAPMQFIDDKTAWVLTSFGLLRTEDGGRSWSWR